jgi:hypothetical protein
MGQYAAKRVHIVKLLKLIFLINDNINKFL